MVLYNRIFSWVQINSVYFIFETPFKKWRDMSHYLQSQNKWQQNKNVFVTLEIFQTSPPFILLSYSSSKVAVINQHLWLTTMLRCFMFFNHLLYNLLLKNCTQWFLVLSLKEIRIFFHGIKQDLYFYMLILSFILHNVK